jgi:hypothetical protein
MKTFGAMLPQHLAKSRQSTEILVAPDLDGRDKPGHDGRGAPISRRGLSFFDKDHMLTERG